MKRLNGLLGFGYFKWQRLITLALIIEAASFLFSLTALSLTGFYRGFTAYLGEDESIIAVYSPTSGTPYTGLVPAFLADRLAEVKGVLAVSPEVTAPCILNGEAVFLRGIMPESFARLNTLRMMEGEFLNKSDISSAIAIVGENIARRLGLKVNGDGNRNGNILLVGVLADKYVELRIKGIFHTGSMLDDEILAPLHVGQWLRGAGYNQVTLIRLKIERSNIVQSEISKVIEAEASKEAPPIKARQTPQEPPIPRTMVRFRLENIGVEEASKYMMKYMEKYGVTRESLLTLSVAVFLFSSLTIILATETILAQHKSEISIIRALGASRNLLKKDFILKLSPWILAASMAGMLEASAALAVIQERGYPQFLCHTFPFNFDPIVAALNLILVFALTSISILKSNVE
ncbi:MAG: ABC transporter permease [Candidatus Bathyarchaeia archaeon]